MKPAPKVRTLDEIRALAESITPLQLAVLLRHIKLTSHEKLGGVKGILIWDERTKCLLPPSDICVHGNAVQLTVEVN